jgi:hypothetical protein
MRDAVSVGGLAVVRGCGRPVRVVDRWRPAPDRIWRWLCSDGCWYFGRELRVVDEDGYREAELEWELEQTLALDEREFIRE